MISRILAAALLQANPLAAPRPAEVWEPWLSWGCVVREGKGEPFVVNGIVARRNEPHHPIDFKRHERALRVLRDDSGAFAGLQARSPLFVVRPTEFWAIFLSDGSETESQRRSLTLKVPHTGGRGSINLFRGKPGAKPYATGSCVSRVEPQEARS